MTTALDVRPSARAVLIVIHMGLVLLASAAARSAVLTVNNTADQPDAAHGDGFCETAPGNGVCTLRAAIQEANATAGADVIVLPAGLYTLTIAGRGEDGAATGDLDITDSLTLLGSGAATTIVQACAIAQGATSCQGIDRVFHIDPAGGVITVVMSGITVQHGLTVGIPFVSNMGGGILLGVANTAGGTLPAGQLTLSNAVVRANAATHAGGESRGGGLASKGGTLTLVRTTVSANSAATGGAGIFQEWSGPLRLNASTVAENTGGSGAALFTTGGEVVINGSTLSGNHSFGAGGALFNYRANVLVTNSTVSGNLANAWGGGLANEQGSLTLASSTITDNQANCCGGGGGVQGAASALNTIIARNRVGGTQIDCDGPLTSQGYNIIQTIGFPFSNPSCQIVGNTTGNIIGQAAGLGVLTDNGGPTRTHALLGTSPAIGAGNPAVPGSSATACTATDQRSIERPAPIGGRCDIGAFELQGLAVNGMAPDHAGDAAPVVALVYGNGFSPGATARLTRAGEADIPGMPAAVSDRNTVISASFDVTGRARGGWDLVVTNPDGTTVTRTAALTLEESRAPELWGDIIGHETIRVGRPARFTIVIGNRGNTDALAVPLVLGIRKEAALKFGFRIAPPPEQPEQLLMNWGSIACRARSSELPHLRIVPIVIPVVPAGFRGTLDFTVTVPPETHGQTLELTAGLGAPYMQPHLTAEVLQALTQGAVAYAERRGIALPPNAIELMEPYAGQLFDRLADTGRRALVEAVGAIRDVYCVPQISIDLVQFVSQASADAEGGDDDGDGEEDDEDDDEEDDEDDDDDDDDEDDDESDCKEGGFNTCAPPPCEKWPPTACGGFSPGPRTIGGAIDPNDKIASLGVGPQRYVTGESDLRYSILFENLETATLPAQEVVITDQLDVNAFDVDTFSLGRISFGRHAVEPPPGSQEFIADVDLPAINLIAHIDARLDRATGVVTWRFTSLDPRTMQPTENPAAGFLPPNTNPPDGDGGLVFTVKPKPSATTGTAICNQASIVFDVNEAIVTPVRCNTIDRTSPASHVLPLPPTMQTRTFTLEWTGTDSHSGIGSYDVLMSENGGPYTLIAQQIELTSLQFTGEHGRTYAFVSVARDRTGNVEPLPPVPDATTRISAGVDLRVTTVSAPPAVVVLKQKFAVTDTVENSGGGTAVASTVRYYLSLDQTRGTGDKQIGGSRPVPSLGPGQISTGTKNATVSNSVTLGIYYLLACADDTKLVAEADELNNCAASATTVEVRAPDLVEGSLGAPPASAARGSSFAISEAVSNIGNAAAGPSTTRYLLSLDTKKSSSDILLTGERAVPGLAVGSTSAGGLTAIVPSTTPAGTYYLLACADGRGKVPEGNVSRTGEKNNCVASQSKVTITP